MFSGVTLLNISVVALVEQNETRQKQGKKAATNQCAMDAAHMRGAFSDL